jgi:hypothetical protein
MDDPSHDSFYPGDIGAPGEDTGIGTLEELVKLLREPIIRPRIQITLRTQTAADIFTSTFTTHLRVNITQVVIPAALAAASDLVAGAAKPIEGITTTAQGATIPCNFIVDPGVDIRLQTQTAVAIFAAAPVSVLLLGTIIN